MASPGATAGHGSRMRKGRPPAALDHDNTHIDTASTTRQIHHETEGHDPKTGAFFALSSNTLPPWTNMRPYGQSRLMSSARLRWFPDPPHPLNTIDAPPLPTLYFQCMSEAPLKARDRHAGSTCLDYAVSHPIASAGTRCSRFVDAFDEKVASCLWRYNNEAAFHARVVLCVLARVLEEIQM